MPAPLVVVDASLDARVAGDRVDLPDTEVHHLRRVLRRTDGSELVVTDGVGRWAPAVLDMSVAMLTSDPVADPASGPRLHVVQAIGRGRRLDDVVRVVTELGVDAVTPLVTERTEVRPAGERSDRLVQRLHAVARSASQQSRRTRLPVIRPPATIAQFEPGALLLVAHPGAEAPLPRVLTSHQVDPDDTVTVVVGPEGGFSDAEIEALEARGGRVVGLGPTVLRTEHAAAAAVAVIAAACGRWS